MDGIEISKGVKMPLNHPFSLSYVIKNYVLFYILRFMDVDYCKVLPNNLFLNRGLL